MKTLIVTISLLLAVSVARAQDDDVFASVKGEFYSSDQFQIKNIYPNPAYTYAFLDYKLERRDVTAKIVIHDLLGTAVQEFELDPNQQQLKISCEPLPKGVYFVTLQMKDESVVTKKLIVKK